MIYHSCIMTITITLCLIILFGLMLPMEAFIWYRPRACIDCHGRYARPGRGYYDGCNRCLCLSWKPMFAVCTLRHCETNECFRSFKPTQTNRRRQLGPRLRYV